MRRLTCEISLSFADIIESFSFTACSSSSRDRSNSSCNDWSQGSSRYKEQARNTMGQVTDGAGYEFVIVQVLWSIMVSCGGRCVERISRGVKRITYTGCTTRACLQHNQGSHVLMLGVIYWHENQRSAPSSTSSSNVVLIVCIAHYTKIWRPCRLANSAHPVLRTTLT